MNNLSRNELIKALVKGLKLDDNIFNYQAVAEETEQVQEKDFMDFYKATMSENTYGNGLQAIIKTAEKFKPVSVDYSEQKAQELISLVYAMNDSIYQKHIESGVSFDVLLDAASFPMVASEDIAILNNVCYPNSDVHKDFKGLIVNINMYPNRKEQLNSFMEAIKYSSSYVIGLDLRKKMIQCKS